ncbi:MAG: LPS export ABC transporter permease LptG [Desulfobacterium sp.]|nr:LPS export ABC transporter permease LptG [Desulfobacterium sp.]
MTTLHRYWFKEFVRFFVIIHLVILAIFVSVDYLSNLDEFLKSDITLVGALGYVCLKLPFMFVQLTPAAIVLAVIVTFGLMNRKNELLALRAGGISVYYLVKPAVLAGLVGAAMMFFLGETLVPWTLSRANHIKYSVIRNDQRVYAAREDLWIRADRTIAHFNFFNPVDRTVQGVTLTFFDDSFTLTRRLDAERGSFKGGEWVLHNVLEQTFQSRESSSGEANVRFHDTRSIELDILPDDLRAVVKKSEEMSFAELGTHVRKIESEGYDATTYRVDLFGKTAFPFICLIMAITGSITGMHAGVRQRLPLGVAIGIGVSFLYWILYGFCTSLGYGGMLPPLVAAWAANLLFICLALILLVNTD